jgi:hypothetical protein
VRPSVTTRGGPVIGGALLIGNEITVTYSSQQQLFLDGTWTLDGTHRLDGLIE